MLMVKLSTIAEVSHASPLNPGKEAVPEREPDFSDESKLRMKTVWIQAQMIVAFTHYTGESKIVKSYVSTQLGNFYCADEADDLARILGRVNI